VLALRRWLSARDAINEVFDQSPFIWLGGSDATTENTFVCNNGETPFPVELFIPGQPDNGPASDAVARNTRDWCSRSSSR